MQVDMKELVFTGSFCVEMVARGVDAISDNEIVVRNRYSLISPGTELALFTGTHVGFTDPEITWARYPIKPGYASIGVVTAIGSEVKSCRIGDVLFHYGTHADISIIKEGQDLCFTIPQGCGWDRALFTRFGQISYTAVAASQKTGAVLVLGGGIIGNLCAQLFALKTGRQVIVADLSEQRLALIARCGLKTINTTTGNLLSSVAALTEGKGVETIVEATGVPDLVRVALQTVNPHGEVILLGSTRGKVELDIYKLIHRKYVSLIGAHENRYPKFGGTESQHGFGCTVIDALTTGTLKVDDFITDHIVPAQADLAYHWLLEDKDHHLGIVIHWQKEE